MFCKLYLGLAVLLDALVSVFTVDSWLDFWIPIVLIPAFFIGFIILHLLFVSIVAIFIDIKKPVENPNRFFRWWVDHTMVLLLSLMRVKLNVSGIEKIPTDRRFLMVSNHRSGFDPIVSIVAFMKFGIIYISKPENFKIPVAAQFIHKSGFLAIDRENARNAMKTIHKATDYVKEDKASVCIYPEGTRSKNGELLEFKDGVFYVCKKAPCPVVAITVQNTENVLKNFPFKKTEININVLTVLEPDCFADKSTHELSEEVRSLMQESLK